MLVVISLPTIFVRNVVLGNFMGPNFALIGVRRILNAAHDFSFKGLAFLGELFHAFRIYVFISWQGLNITRLSAGIGPQTSAALAEHAGIHFAGSAGRPSGIPAN